MTPDRWGPPEARGLLAECGDSYEDAAVGLAAAGLGGALGEIEAATACLASRGWADRETVETVRRDLQVAAGREYLRRLRVLGDVARAHGLHPVEGDS